MLQHLYILQAITTNKPALHILKYKEIYSMIKSDSKVLPKAGDFNAVNTAEPVVKTDSSVNSAKAV